MNVNLVGQVGTVLIALGGGLQWLRAHQGFPEWAYSLIAFGLSVAAFLFCYEAAIGPGWRSVVKVFVENWPILSTFIGATMGGTKAVSGMAKAAANKGANTDSVLIPVTNSK